MEISYGFNIDVEVGAETPLIAQLDIHPSRNSDIVSDRLDVSSDATGGSVYLDAFGNLCRRFVLTPGLHRFERRGIVRDGGMPDHADTAALSRPVSQLPSDVIVYLLASRYCELDRLISFAWKEFGNMPHGWLMVHAICDFAHHALTFDYAQASSTKSACDALAEGTGVCRDFAHVAIALCRAMSIPARYATGYLGDIGVPRDPAPMDFSAWFEAYIGDRWYTFDPRHNRPRIGRVVMAYGRDAADAALVTSFGQHRLARFEVITEERRAPESGSLMSAA